ncbi:hypothetical protein HDU81_004224 [Chytriomyces hyalinus]|nr:hypothetical protein HDU81_004224 [Chytriomyces hyalinus]
MLKLAFLVLVAALPTIFAVDCQKPWDPKKVYQAGTVVSFEGSNYACQWYSTGTAPSAGGAWKLQEACVQPPAPTQTSSGVPLFDSNGFLFRGAPSAAGIIGYWPQWSRYSRPEGALSKINLSGFNIVNYAFMNLNADGTLKTFDSFADEKEIPNFQAAREANPSLRTVLSVGGWSGSVHFSSVAASAAATKTFVTGVHAFLDANGFDGVDLDWEYPGGNGVSCNTVNPNDVSNFAKLLKALREELGPHRIITIATSGEADRYTENGVNYLTEYAKHLNFFLVMTYDFYGAWSPYSDFNSPLFPPGANDVQEPKANKYKNGTVSMSISGSMKTWTDAGVPIGQLVNGLGFYGRSWAVSSGTNNGLYQLCAKSGNSDANPQSCDGVQGDSLDALWCDPCGVCYRSGVWMYSNLRKQNVLTGPTTAGAGWTRKYFDFAENPTLFDGTRFISYDDPVSIKAKAAWAKNAGFSGSMIWELSQDNAGELISAVYDGWASTGPAPSSAATSASSTSSVPAKSSAVSASVTSRSSAAASSAVPSTVVSTAPATSAAATSATNAPVTSAKPPATSASSSASAPSPTTSVPRPNIGTKVVGGYLLLNPTEGPSKLRALAQNAATLPINRIFLSFVRPDMVYVPGSNTLEHSDIGYATSGDFGFAEVKKYVQQLQAGGVEVFLSMGGWNYNCFPYFYTKYSIGSFPTGPNYWKIKEYGLGSTDGCNESNMWCYTCEPQSANTTLKDFIIFPEPEGTATWQAAQNYITQNSKGDAVHWNPQFIGGATIKDPIDGKTLTTVPGNNYWSIQKRDPYADFVYLAKDLGLDGIDLDYEEMWHADTFRNGKLPGPFKLDQTVYKYTAIAYDMMNVIQDVYPICKFATAAGAAGAWQGNWWGGNLKGLWYFSNLWFPEVTAFMSVGANAGGINVMSYDLSNNNQFYECPNTPNDCDLAGQVKFYMNTYAIANIPARVGYEIGQAAYPDPAVDPTHQIPLTQAALDSILGGISSVSTQGGFFWELYKPKNSLPTGPNGQPNNLDVTSVAQQVCAKILPGAARCTGVIPDFTISPPKPTSAQSSVVVPTSSVAATASSSEIKSSTRILTTSVASSAAPVTSSALPVTSSASQSVVTAPVPTTTTSVPSGSDCYPAWDASTVYAGRNQVSFNGINYENKWWTQGSSPDKNADGVWTSKGACGGSGSVKPVTTGSPFTPSDCYPEWDASLNYKGNSKVSFKGKNYVNTWWQNPGWDPVSNKDGGWVLQGTCGGVVTSAPATSVSVAPSTASSSSVASATIASSSVKTSASAAQSPTSAAPVSTVPPPASSSSKSATAPSSVSVSPPTPSSSTTPVPGTGLPGCSVAWSDKQSYNANVPVSLNNINYVTKWYQAVGSNPSVNPDGGWTKEGPCDPKIAPPTNPNSPPPVPTTLADSIKYAASLSQDSLLVGLKRSSRVNRNVDGISPGNPANPENVKRVETIITPAKWNFYFSQADPSYTYTNFLKSVGFFAGFCDTYEGKDSDAICKKILSTLFAHFAQETGAHDAGLPIPEWRQSLKYVREMSCTENNTISGCYYNNDCTNPAFNKIFPCGSGPSNGYLAYFGRGAHQLSYSFNYGPFSEVIYGDPKVLLNNPALVADTWLNLASAIFFFIYPQPPKPSMLGVMDGSWVPSAADIAAGRTNDFPSTIQIINGECSGSSTSKAAQNRINYYKAFMQDMGLTTGNDNLKCSGMQAFDTSSSGTYKMYWTGSYSGTPVCQLVPYQTNFNALMDGPSYEQYVACVEFTFNVKLA